MKLKQKHFSGKFAAACLMLTMTAGQMTAFADIDPTVPSPLTGSVSPVAADSIPVPPPVDGNAMAPDSSGQVASPVTYPSLSTIVTEGEKENNWSEPIFGGATLTFRGSGPGGQTLSMVLETSNGSLIVIDGGFEQDADSLRNHIKDHGGRVAAWLVTHPHGDHVGALNKLLQANNGISIYAIYCSLASKEWYTASDPTAADMAIRFIDTLSRLPQNKVHYVSKNQMIQVDDVTIQVLNDRYDLTNTGDSHYTGNNASIVYMLTINGKRLLILGDMCYEGGQRLLEDVGAPGLKADLVQMAHHGQDGVSEEVYQAIQPSICLWPTPKWLWEGDESQYATQTTKRWMVGMGVEKHYVMKDGEQIIQ